jgi:ActR/RegA family two-component response regulator
VVGAARRLGIHRNKVRRWLERYAVDAEHFRG